MKPEAAIYLQQETKGKEEVNAEQVEKILIKCQNMRNMEKKYL